jgi:hypothetical protein
MCVCVSSFGLATAPQVDGPVHYATLSTDPAQPSGQHSRRVLACMGAEG